MRRELQSQWLKMACRSVICGWLGFTAAAFSCWAEVSTAVEVEVVRVTRPSAWINFYRGTNGHIRLDTASAVHGPDLSSAATPCPPRASAHTPVVSESWMRLAFEVGRDDEALLEQWLDNTTATTSGITNRVMLQRIWSALAVGIEHLRGARGRPQIVEFVVQIGPVDCLRVSRVSHSQAQAQEKLSFPLTFHTPAFLRPDNTADDIYELVNIATHELVHILQDHPFSMTRLRQVLRSPRLPSSGPHPEVSLGYELHARMVDHCLRQAIVPDDWNRDRLAQTWRDRRPEFWSLVGTDPFGKMYDTFFSRQQRILGTQFVGQPDDRGLETLFGYCALYLRRDPPVLASTRPSHDDIERGRAAWRAVREVTAPIRFQRRLYGRFALP